MNDLTHLSLFSGIGGLDLAAEWAGFRTVGQCEWADYPRAVLEKHWPGMPRWRDIRTLTGDDFYAKTGLRTVTVLSGGFPCQPFSTAGKRRGKEDDRYLWPEMLRVIQEIRPAWVVGENVAGIVSMALDTVLSDLESIGYTCQAFVIPACAVDAPHRRDRVAIIAHSDCDDGGSRWAESTGQQGSKLHGTPDAGWKTKSHGSACECGSDVANTDGGTVRDDCHDRRTSDRKVNEAVNAGVFGGTEESDTDCDNRSRNVRRECELPAIERNGRCRSYFTGGAPEYGGGEWWPAEPDVGRSHDGFSCWLDGIGGLSDAAKARAGEILRNLRKETYSEAIQWAVGRFDGISETEILLAYLCEHEESSYCGRRAEQFRKDSCEICGARLRLHAHHIDGNIAHNWQKNIQTLCFDCHMAHHRLCRRLGRTVPGRAELRELQAGFPLGWTDLSVSETQSCPSSSTPSSGQ